MVVVRNVPRSVGSWMSTEESLKSQQNLLMDCTWSCEGNGEVSEVTHSTVLQT